MDPIFAEIVLLLGQFCLVLFCVATFVWERRAKGGAHAWIWLLLAAALAMLILQHATGAGAALTDVFRQQAHQEGWYAERRALQGQLVRLAPVVGLVCLAGLLLAIRKNWLRYLPAVVACVYLVGYGAVQAVSLHAVDAVMRRPRLGVRTEIWLELAGLVLVGAAVAWSAAWARRQARFCSEQALRS